MNRCKLSVLALGVVVAAVGLAAAAGIYGPMRFYDTVEGGSWTAIGNAVATAVPGGTYTNGLSTNYYALCATNLKGRIPASTNLVVAMDGSAAQSAAALSWPRYDGISGYVVLRSLDEGVTWTNWTSVSATLTNWTDYGTTAWTNGDLLGTVPVIPDPVMPWSVTTLYAVVTNVWFWDINGDPYDSPALADALDALAGWRPMGGDVSGNTATSLVTGVRGITVDFPAPGSAQDGYGLMYDYATHTFKLAPVVEEPFQTNYVRAVGTGQQTDIAFGEVGFYRIERPGNIPSMVLNAGGLECLYVDALGLTLRSGSLALLGGELEVNVASYDGDVAAPAMTWAAQRDLGRYRYSHPSGNYAEGHAVETNLVWSWTREGLHIETNAALYLKGYADLDGSWRIRFDNATDGVTIERRLAGEWVATSLGGGGGELTPPVSLDAANAYTNVYGGKLTKLGAHVTAGTGSSVDPEAGSAVAMGQNAQATGIGSSAFGVYTLASGQAAHAQGAYTRASGTASHARGYMAKADGLASEASGFNTSATNDGSFVWQGTSGDMSEPEYQDNGPGTFNANPVGGIDGFFVGTGGKSLRAIIEEVNASRAYPVFHLPLGDNWTDYQLQASTNNFGGCVTGLVYEVVSFGAVTNGRGDTNVWTYYCDNYAAKPQQYILATNGVSIASQLISPTGSVVRAVIVQPSHDCEWPWASWMSSTNATLTWAYRRWDAIGPDTAWTPIVPVEWKQSRIRLD